MVAELNVQIRSRTRGLWLTRLLPLTRILPLPLRKRAIMTAVNRCVIEMVVGRQVIASQGLRAVEGPNGTIILEARR